MSEQEKVVVTAQPEEKQYDERVVVINRVTKVVKGGRRFRFAALVVVGDYNGHVGFGSGKAQEVPEAIKKAVEDAKKNMIEVPIVGTTIPHEITGVHGAGQVFLKPAPAGTGIIADACERAGGGGTAECGSCRGHRGAWRGPR